MLSELRQPEYELALLVATCGLRISEALGLRWRNILWDRGLIAIRETFVHFNMQDGAKTTLSRSRVEAPQLLLDSLAAWRQKTTYAEDEDFVFPFRKAERRAASQRIATGSKTIFALLRWLRALSGSRTVSPTTGMVKW